MIEVRDAGEMQLPRRVELAQDVRERHGVGATRHPSEHARARRNQVVLANEEANAIEYSVHDDDEGG